ncbi:MAG TPA: hypothetical protein VKT28_07765 [Puia sp.]|nr:hypothetical protein [Puia sp.]
MKTDELKYIKTVTIKSIRNVILDNNLTEKDTITLHKNDFDNIVLEYRQTYGIGITVPYFLLSVLIEEDKNAEVFEGRLGIILNDDLNPARINKEGDKNYLPKEIVHRCGWCGNVVDNDGGELTTKLRNHKIEVLEKYGDEISEKVHGYCCINRDN